MYLKPLKLIMILISLNINYFAEKTHITTRCLHKIIYDEFKRFLTVICLNIVIKVSNII